MKTEMKVLLYIKRSEKDKDGLSPLMGRIAVRGKNNSIAQFSCKFKVDVRLWNATAQRCTGKSRMAVMANREIERTLLLLRQRFNELKDIREVVSAEEVKNAYQGLAESQDTIMKLFAEHKEKEQIIRKSGILDYFPKNENLKDVGGMKVLKDWLFKRQKAYEKKARDFGLQEPKGLLLLGVPGCGKSLTAKTIASFWNMPLLRLDIGKVFQGLVGSSEDNIRKAIATAEAVAPCVLWIDEIEKGLSGVQSSGATDGGVTSRIFSTILTWMQEKTSPVFVVATANNINLLPPELLRKGRFDEIFFVDLPNEEERRKIFEIHLIKKNQNTQTFPLEMLSKKTDGFNGAEIEECIKEAMFAAYVDNPENPKLEAKYLMDAINKTVPLSTTMKEQISALRQWASTRAKNASVETVLSQKKEMPVLLTRPEFELERSFDINRKNS